MSFMPLMRSIFNIAIPAYTAYQMLEKKGPKKLKDFSKLAIGAGYTADEIIGYLRDHFESPAKKEERQYLKERTRSGMARPEERLRSTELEEAEKQKDLLQRGASVGVGLAAAGGPGAIVESLLGGGTAEVGEEPTAEAGTGNPIRDIDPALADVVEKRLRQQGDPLAAGQLVKTMGMFNKSIGQLEKSLGQLFPDIVASVYGGQQETRAEAAPAPSQERSATDPEFINMLSKVEGGEGQKLTAQDMIEAAGRAREGMREGINFFKSMFNQ